MLGHAESFGMAPRQFSVGHGTGRFEQMYGFSITYRAGQGPAPWSLLHDNNGVNRNG